MDKAKAVRSVPVRTALVIGGARCVWRDIEGAFGLGRYDAIVCVNDIGVDYPERIDFWCTLHPEKFLRWQNLRAEKGGNTDYVAYCHEPNTWLGPKTDHPRIDKWTDYRYPGMTGSGSSGLLAVKVAQEEGFDRIVLAGIPMQVKENHYFDGALWHEGAGFLDAWEIAKLRLTNVRSMSGWTRGLLGAPTSQWLCEPSTSGADNG